MPLGTTLLINNGEAGIVKLTLERISGHISLVATHAQYAYLLLRIDEHGVHLSPDVAGGLGIAIDKGGYLHIHKIKRR